MSVVSRVAAGKKGDAAFAVMDLIAIVVSYMLALVLRFEGQVPIEYWKGYLKLIPIIAGLHLIANHRLGLYGQMWRYASVHEARRVITACALAGVAVAIVVMVLRGQLYPVPLSVVLMGASGTLLCFGALRFHSRLFAFNRLAVRSPQDKKRVLIVGAGEAGSMVLKDIVRNPSLALSPVGILDDDIKKIGKSLHGVPVLGPTQILPRVVSHRGVDDVVLTIPSATSELVREMAELCESASVGLRVLPTVRETLGGRVTAKDIRDLQIEDLLGRQQVETDLESVASMLRGQKVLVTGAGGSIGSEIVRQVAAFEPSRLILLDNDETHLHDVLIELENVSDVHVELADIRDRRRIVGIVMDHAPDTIFHAAAHKHVPILEDQPEEAFYTNIMGTANLADAAAAAGTVQRFVLISTDKAIKPLSVMGASKWFAEQIVQSLQGSGCTFCAVRFGNVLGSRGSVIPTFLKQIQRGGPVTVTDPQMTRYFMSIQEAVQLVLQAGAMSRGGQVLTLDMGQAINILDLARKVIRLSGRVPNTDIPIVFTGARPGEKLVENLFDEGEEMLPSEHPSIFISVISRLGGAALRRHIRELEALAVDGEREALASRLKALATATPVDETKVSVGESA